MTYRPQTIQIFLPSGDPRGVRVADITTRIIRVIEVPRSLLSEFLRMPEAQQVGIYFLVGESENGENQKVYVGQSGSVGERLSSHNQKKDFWNKALVVISLTNSMTQTHALFLEWFSIKQAQEVSRYVLENGNTGARPHTPAPLEADCYEIHDTARTLMATLGYPIFEAVSTPISEIDNREIYYCKGDGAEGVGQYTSEGFVVLLGSKARIKNVESIAGTSSERFREKLVTSGVMVEKDGMYVFTKDHLFGSPSMAAIAVLGRTANGWKAWKDKDGSTLDALKRANAN
ncbi:MAG: GIY-YIG nuclease family protein [Burkholderiaceae bacterium]